MALQLIKKLLALEKSRFPYLSPYITDCEVWVSLYSCLHLVFPNPGKEVVYILGAQKVEFGQNEVKRIGGCEAIEFKWLLAIRGTKGIDVGGTVVLFELFLQIFKTW